MKLIKGQSCCICNLRKETIHRKLQKETNKNELVTDMGVLITDRNTMLLLMNK